MQIRDSVATRRYLLHGLTWQRLLPLTAETIRPTLTWTLELAASGEPVPPTGFVADVGLLALRAQEGVSSTSATLPADAPAGLIRRYEDYVLGKLYADGAFDRGADALARYQERDRDKAVSFLISQLARRAKVPGVELSPAVIKSLRQQPPDDLLKEAWQPDPPAPWLPEMYEQLTDRVRNLGDLLGPEDVFELEHGTALAEFSQRVALRQVVQAAARLAEELPRLPPRALARRHGVATHLMDEDAYPVGGFSSISTRGTIESLLHSQLAYMEREDRPDLFDIKFLRDELLYYSRDENQFLRRRRTFFFVLWPDLVQARIKDVELPWQRIVLTLAVIWIAVKKLTEWLSEEALTFEIVFVKSGKDEALAAERELLEMLLREERQHGTAIFQTFSPTELLTHAASQTRRSLCQLLHLSATDRNAVPDGCAVTRMQIAAARPQLAGELVAPPRETGEAALDEWQQALENLLQSWL